MTRRNGLEELTKRSNDHRVDKVPEVHLGWEFCFAQDSQQVFRGQQHAGIWTVQEVACGKAR